MPDATKTKEDAYEKAFEYLDFMSIKVSEIQAHYEATDTKAFLNSGVKHLDSNVEDPLEDIKTSFETIVSSLEMIESMVSKETGVMDWCGY